MASNVLDISALAADAAVIDGESMIDAGGQLGDAEAQLTAVAMHSATERVLRKQGLIDGRTALPAILWGVPVSAAAAFLSAGAAPELLRRAFGGLCFAVGLREVLAKKR